MRDATAELVRQNELLERQRLELEQASAAKSQFLANMSHEFRTPLNAIMGYTSMLQQGVFGALDARAEEEPAARRDSNARHLMAIINDILDISRIEAGRLPAPRQPASRSPSSSPSSWPRSSRSSRASKLKVRTDVEPSLPAISSDRPKVKQILLNLLTNAFKFTPKGSVDGERAAPARPAGSSRCRWSTPGSGSRDKDQEKVFEDFQQADNSPAREYGGVGLGLSICRRLATMLDGRLALKSEVGKGSTFTLVRCRSRRGESEMSESRRRPTDEGGPAKPGETSARARPRRRRFRGQPRDVRAVISSSRASRSSPPPTARRRSTRPSSAARPHRDGPLAARPRRLGGDAASEEATSAPSDMPVVAVTGHAFTGSQQERPRTRAATGTSANRACPRTWSRRSGVCWRAARRKAAKR